MKTISAIIAASILFGGAAYAGDPNYPGAIERGNAGLTAGPGMPVGDLWVCDATAKPPKPGRKPRTCKF